MNTLLSKLGGILAFTLSVNPATWAASASDMQLAAEQLRGRRWSVAQIAFEVGYESEAAFSRAFKRQFGTSPGNWRRQ